MLAFTSVYFLESSLFNGLQPFGVKNFALFLLTHPLAPRLAEFFSPLHSPDFHRTNSTEDRRSAKDLSATGTEVVAAAHLKKSGVPLYEGEYTKGYGPPGQEFVRSAYRTLAVEISRFVRDLVVRRKQTRKTMGNGLGCVGRLGERAPDLRRRRAMKPRPAAPSSIIAHVDGSGAMMGPSRKH